VIDYPVEHLRVLGPPGSGKTRTLIERFRALRAKGVDVRVLTYTTESYRRIAESILEKGQFGLGPDPVVQYSRLANEIVALSGGRRPALLNDVEERLLLESVITANLPVLPKTLRSICRSDRFVRDLLDVIHSLLQCGLERERVERLAAPGGKRRPTSGAC
jgi:ATP-dependent helicase/DNAse subunit B